MTSKSFDIAQSVFFRVLLLLKIRELRYIDLKVCSGMKRIPFFNKLYQGEEAHEHGNSSVFS
jgi:hypothetical protein